MRDFAVATLTPIALTHPGLAVATARAGGIALLDAGLCAGGEVPQAHGHLRKLLDLAPLAPVSARIGLRLRTGQIPALAPLLADLAGRDHILLFGEGAPSRADLDGLPASAGRQVWVEVTAVEQAAHFEVAGVPIGGLLARGQECGGFVGADPAFILAQKLAAAGLEIPFYVQGGIGVHTAAACRAAGAAGVVLDDTLWLMPESPLPAPLASAPPGSRRAGDLGPGRRPRGALPGLLPPRPRRRAGAAACRGGAAPRPGDLAERRLRWRLAAEERLGWGPPQETRLADRAGGGARRPLPRPLPHHRPADPGDARRQPRPCDGGAEHAPLAPGAPLAEVARHPLPDRPGADDAGQRHAGLRRRRWPTPAACRSWRSR